MYLSSKPKRASTTLIGCCKTVPIESLRDILSVFKRVEEAQQNGMDWIRWIGLDWNGEEVFYLESALPWSEKSFVEIASSRKFKKDEFRGCVLLRLTFGRTWVFFA